MGDTGNPVFTGFDDAVLERWGLKPAAKDTLNRARQTGAITPQEITEMVSAALAKDRKKMAEVLGQLKRALKDLKINVTFNIVQHNHPTQPATVTPAASVIIPQPQPQSVVPVVSEPLVPHTTTKGPQQPEGQGESPFLNAKILQDNGLEPEALGILLAAQARGSITAQQIGTLIPAEISQDAQRLRPTMLWITKLLGGLSIRIVIGEVHQKDPQSRSPETSYSRRPKQPSVKKNNKQALPDPTQLGEEPSETELAELEREENDTTSEVEGNEESEYADPNEKFVPKFIFDKESGVTNPYYRAVKDHKFLKHKDILELARRWRLDGDVHAYQKIVEHHLRYSMKIASHYMGKGLDYDDLVQEGNMGLMVAAERFDPERGFHFTTYATWWVRQHMQRAIQNFKNTIRLPVWVSETLSKVLRITCKLGQELQREPTLEEVAVRAELPVEEVDRILHRLNIPIVSLEELAYGHSSKYDTVRTIGDTIMDHHFPSAVTALEAKEDLEEASRMVRTLLAAVKALSVSERDKTAFKMYYGLDGHSEDNSMQSIADSPGFNVTRARVQQILEKVWKRLREHGIMMDDEGLMTALKRVHDLENIVCAEADLSTPDEAFVLREVLATMNPEHPQANLTEVPLGTTTPEDIIRVVGNVYGKSQEVILGKSRRRDIVWARKVCTYIMREKLKLSFPDIGKALGYAEHTSTIHGYQSVKKAIEGKPAIGGEIEKIVSLCGFQPCQQASPEQVTPATEPTAKIVSPIVDQVLTLTSQVFNVEKASLSERSRTGLGVPEERTLARRVAIYLLRTDFNIQRQDITPVFGFTDPSRVSVISGEMEEQVKTDTDLQAKLAIIRSQYSLEVYGGDLTQVRAHQSTLFPKQVEELKVVVEEVVRSFQERVQQLHVKLEAIDLPDHHKEIFRLRFGGDPLKENPAYEVIGQTYNVTRERVRQILVATITKLTPALDQTDIDLVVNYTQEHEKARLVVELQNL